MDDEPMSPEDKEVANRLIQGVGDHLREWFPELTDDDMTRARRSLGGMQNWVNREDN